MTYNRCQITLEPSIIPEKERPTLKPGGVLISREGWARKIETEVYEADWLRTAACQAYPSMVSKCCVPTSMFRGAYFLQGRTLQLNDVKQLGPTTIAAQNSLASIRYEFAHDKMTWTVENKSSQPMPFFVVFDTSVTAVSNRQGEWSKLPTTKDLGDPKWSTTTWFAGRAKLKMTGGSKVWGPWVGKYQVWEASLAPKETGHHHRNGSDRSKRGKQSGCDYGKQTDSGDRFDAVLTARLSGFSTPHQATWTNDDSRKSSLRLRSTRISEVRRFLDWLSERPVGRNPSKEKTRTFEASVDTPAGGWYKVEVRAMKLGKSWVRWRWTTSVSAKFLWVLGNPTDQLRARTHQAILGMVSSFSGTAWQLADDPQPGVHDNSMGGSYWPAFGDEMYAKYHVPIGVASTGHSGTSVNQWIPGGELFRWMTTRMKELGREGFRAVLWHQGESGVIDVGGRVYAEMTALIEESRRAVGWEVPWFVAEVSYHNPSQTSFPTTRAGQKKLWDLGVAFEGPDTDTLTGDNRDEGGKGSTSAPRA